MVLASTSTGGIGVFGRGRTGIGLTRSSLTVVREDPELLVFPALGGLSALLFWALLLVPLVLADFLGSGLEYIVLFVLYFATTFASSFFTAALVHAISRTFHGQDPSVRESVAAAWEMRGPLLVWSFVSAVVGVGVVLRWLEERDSAVASVVRSLFAPGWTVTTFFVIPVVVFEDVTPRSMFERSAATFRDTWGESLGAGFGITFVQIAIGLAGVLLGVVCFAVLVAVNPAAGFVAGIFVVGGALLGAYLVGETIWAVTKTALYLYAAEGLRPAAFADFDFETLDGRSEGSAARAATTATDGEPVA